MVACSALYTSPVKAQEKKDTITVVQPVLNGTQKDLADTVQAYAAGVADPQLKVVLTDVVTTIKNVPDGKDPAQWYGWIVAVLASLMAAYAFIKAKFFSKPSGSADSAAQDYRSSAGK